MCCGLSGLIQSNKRKGYYYEEDFSFDIWFITGLGIGAGFRGTE
jgi:hypothetical protein